MRKFFKYQKEAGAAIDSVGEGDMARKSSLISVKKR
jgi:hypothetical protein